MDLAVPTVNRLPVHSKNKLTFYEGYLVRYLAILLRADWIDQINIFDLFCGAGIYKDGERGSPIIAFDAIERAIDRLTSQGKIHTKKIRLIVNDIKKEHIDTVTKYINACNSNDNICELVTHNNEFEELIDEMISFLGKQSTSVRNLLFLDPYGYKSIKREYIENLLANRRSEIMLFLPVMEMYRFVKPATNNPESAGIKPLVNFIHEFDIDTTNLNNQIDFIEQIKNGLKFSGKYYVTSFYLKRENSGNYNALFHITPHRKGAKKALEVAFEIDESTGKGTDINLEQGSLFGFSEIQGKEVQDLIIAYLKQNPEGATNIQLSDYLLDNALMDKHGTRALKSLQKENKIAVWDKKTQQNAPKRAFYLDDANKEVIISLTN
jgi:three-Cys-motif partner protein